MTPFKSAREVIQAMLDGKKVAWWRWDNDGSSYKYICMDKDGHIVDETGKRNEAWDFSCDGLSHWHLYEETPERWEWLLRQKDSGRVFCPDTFFTKEDLDYNYSPSDYEIVQRLRGPFK